MVNKLMRNILYVTASAMLSLQAAYAVPSDYDTSTRIEHPAFHTLQTRLNGNEQLFPIITLNSDDRLEIIFDELADERRYMRYELIHCDALWRPDKLVSPEYLDGFNEATVDDYAFSQSTLAHYVNYIITIPNADMQPTLSGNYLIRVFDENVPEITLLQVRFCIVEPMMKTQATVSSRTDIDHNDRHQQLTIGVDINNVNVNSVYNDLIVTVEQNGRIDNTASVTMPTRIAGNMLWYEHNPRLIFPAGNEYRRMEIVSTTYPGMGVAELSYAAPYYHATLKTDYQRTERPYVYDQTQFGRFKIREYNANDSDIESDYIITHFSLDMPEQPDIDIFIDGDMVQRRFTPESRMVYNRATGLYECAMLLKQGAYNYQYLTVPHGSMSGSSSLIEGDHYQTANQYLIKVYHRQPGVRYDQLVSTTMVTSGV